MQYIPPLIFSSLGLVDPAVTAVLSWLVGVESLPSLVTWLGGFTVMAGVGVITIGEHLRRVKTAEHDIGTLIGDGDTAGDTAVEVDVRYVQVQTGDMADGETGQQVDRICGGDELEMGAL